MKNTNQTTGAALLAKDVCTSPQIASMSKAIDCAVVAVLLAQAAVYREQHIVEIPTNKATEPVSDSNYSNVLKKLELLSGFESGMHNGLSLIDSLLLCREKAVRLGISIGDFGGVSL